jgi:signal transduction histidine kinase
LSNAEQTPISGEKRLLPGELEISARLEEIETMLRTLFDALPMGIVIRDEFGARQFANGFMLREDAPGAVGIPYADLIEGARDWERHQVEADANVLETEKSFEFVVESVMGQQTRWLHCIEFLVPAASGGVRRIGTLIIDITRQKKIELEAHSLAERRREFLEMQREFISMVSHEFRTPLTTIRGAQYLLQKLFKRSKGMNRPVVESAEKWLGLQESALETLGKLVDQVLMLNRIEHMTGEASLDQLSPADVIADTVARFNESMDSPRVALRNEVPPGYVASMDSGLVKAATENLISNGLKYSSLDKTVRVLVRVELDGWVVEVSDSGRGIPAGDQANLFRPFFRARNVGTVHGTGLGLAIVQRAVNFHGGRVEFESNEDSGTRFALHFPRVARPLHEEAKLGLVPMIARKDGDG